MGDTLASGWNRVGTHFSASGSGVMGVWVGEEACGDSGFEWTWLRVEQLLET